MRQRCEARRFKRSTIEIIARQKVAPAFEAEKIVAGGRLRVVVYVGILTMRTGKDRAKSSRASPPAQDAGATFCWAIYLQPRCLAWRDRSIRRAAFNRV